MAKNCVDVSVDSHDQEVRKEVIVNTICVCDIASPTDLLIACFSDWRRLKTAVAWKVKGHVAGTVARGSR